MCLFSKATVDADTNRRKRVKQLKIENKVEKLCSASKY
jgi:hypothetical protein